MTLFAAVLGATIENLRRQRKWTQPQLAERVGLSQPTLSRIEAGKSQPNAQQFERMAKVLGHTVMELLSHVNGTVSIITKSRVLRLDAEVLEAVARFKRREEGRP
jgi:transcriptional regulator with XRE-family HTH domain